MQKTTHADEETQHTNDKCDMHGVLSTRLVSCKWLLKDFIAWEKQCLVQRNGLARSIGEDRTAILKSPHAEDPHAVGIWTTTQKNQNAPALPD